MEQRGLVTDCVQCRRAFLCDAGATGGRTGTTAHDAVTMARSKLALCLESQPRLAGGFLGSKAPNLVQGRRDLGTHGGPHGGRHGQNVGFTEAVTEDVTGERSTFTEAPTTACSPRGNALAGRQARVTRSRARCARAGAPIAHCRGHSRVGPRSEARRSQGLPGVRAGCRWDRCSHNRGGLRPDH